MEEEEKSNLGEENNSKESNVFDEIFGNAVSTTKKYGNQNSGLETKTCKNCGAPRPEKTDLKKCSYCSYEYLK